MKLKIILLVALLFAFSAVNFAQTKKTKTATKQTTSTAAFKGSINAQKAAFKAFIIKNVGKTVSLDLKFDGDIEPYGYRSEFADPIFEVDNYRYFLICNDGEDANAAWTDRCKKLNWDNENKTLKGTFKITEPDPKNMRTNRTFEITPVEKYSI